MDDFLKRKLLSLDMLSRLKKSGVFNSVTARLLQTSLMKSDPSREIEQLETAIALSKMCHSPFQIPDESVDGPVRFAISENNQPIGIFPHECHFFCAGSSGTGKTFMLKIIFAQALLSNKDTENAK